MKINCCWLYAISKYGYPPNLPDTLQAIDDMVALGFNAIELEGVREDNLRVVSGARRELRQRADDAGAKIVNFCPVLPDLISFDRAKRHKALELFDLACELANYFGCDTIQTDSYTPPLQFTEKPYDEMVSFARHFGVRVDPDFDWNRLWGTLVESVGTCAEKAGAAGLPLCLEPRVGENVTNTDAVLRLIDAVGSDNFGAVFDTGHQNAQKEILPLSVEKLGKRIFYVHCSDNDSRDNHHLAIGRGSIDWIGVFTALKKHGFDGWVGVDVGRVPDLDAQYRESKAYLDRLAAELEL